MMISNITLKECKYIQYQIQPSKLAEIPTCAFTGPPSRHAISLCPILYIQGGKDPLLANCPFLGYFRPISVSGVLDPPSLFPNPVCAPGLIKISGRV